MTSLPLALALTAVLAPTAGLALPADFAARHGIDPATPEASRPAGTTGFGYRSVSRDASGNLVFTDAVIEEQGRRLTAGRLTLAEDVFAAEALALSAHDPGFEQGTILTAGMEARFPGAGRILSGIPSTCDPAALAVAYAPLHEIRVTGVSMAAPALEGAGPLAAVRTGVNPESLTLSSGTMAVRAGAGDCLEVTRADFTGLAARAVSGETITADRLGTSLERAVDGSLAASFDLAAVTVSEKIRLGRLGMRLDLGAGTLQAVAAGRDPQGATGGDADLSGILLARGGRISIALGGLDLSPREAFPAEALAASGLAKTERISGDASFELSLQNGLITVAQASDLDGLLSNRAGLRLKLADAPLPAAPSMMGLLSALSLVDAEFSLADKGLTGVIETAAGRPLAEVLDQAGTRMGPVPPAISGPVLAWIGKALAEGGSVNAAPTAPVPLAAIGMAAAVDPDGLAGLLNVTAR